MVSPFTYAKKGRRSRKWLMASHDIRTIQDLLGHQDVKTTMIYTRVLNRGSKGVRSAVGVP